MVNPTPAQNPGGGNDDLITKLDAIDPALKEDHKLLVKLAGMSADVQKGALEVLGSGLHVVHEHHPKSAHKHALEAKHKKLKESIEQRQPDTEGDNLQRQLTQLDMESVVQNGADAIVKNATFGAGTGAVVSLAGGIGWPAAIPLAAMTGGYFGGRLIAEEDASPLRKAVYGGVGGATGLGLSLYVLYQSGITGVAMTSLATPIAVGAGAFALGGAALYALGRLRQRLAGIDRQGVFKTMLGSAMLPFTAVRRMVEGPVNFTKNAIGRTVDFATSPFRAIGNFFDGGLAGAKSMMPAHKASKHGHFYDFGHSLIRLPKTLLWDKPKQFINYLASPSGGGGGHGGGHGH